MNNLDGLYTHNMPQFGFYRINQDRRSVCLKLSDPPNDKKRHDKMIDLTAQLTSAQRNVIEIMQTFKAEKDPFKYVCAIFIVKSFDPHDLINFIKNYQPVVPFERGLELIKKRFVKPASTLTNQDDECQIHCSDLKIDLICNNTLLKIKTPIKG
jgi:hypothetical protein